MKNLNNNTLFRRGITPSRQGILLFLLFLSFSSFAQINIPATGSATYTVCNTNVYDNGGSAEAYSNDCNGYVVLNPELPGHLISVSGTVEAEGGYDYLTIYEGTGTGGAILWGGSPHGSGTTCATFSVPQITSTSGPLTIRFYSDASNTCAGLNLTVSCVPGPPWKSSWITMNIGSSNWLAGQTRTVSVTVKNIGSAIWTDALPDVNIGCKWNAEPDYAVRVNAGNLAPGETRTYYFTMTAPMTTGTNNLTFDVVKEGDCWFGYNSGTCGPGNIPYSSSVLTIDNEMKLPANGNNSYMVCSGNLYDSGGSAGNYTDNSNGYTVLYPEFPNNKIQISGSINVESGYDYLTIYDGAGIGGAILWGGSIHGSATSCEPFTVPQITSSTGPITIRFYSDVSTNCSGINLAVTCIPPPPFDAKLLSFAPAFSATACGYSTNETVSVNIQNTGSDTITSLPVSYMVNNILIASEACTDTILPNAVITYTFNTSVDLSANNTYAIKAFTALTGDANAFNDTIQITTTQILTTPTYYNSFNTAADRENWAIFDMNADAKTWNVSTLDGYSSSPAFYYNFHTSNAANDWLISKCIYLEQGFSYKLNFVYKVESASYPESFEVKMGTAQNPAAMTGSIVSYTNLTNTNFLTSSNTITVPVSGIYYIGFRCFSAADKFNLYIDEFKIYRQATAAFTGPFSKCNEATNTLPVTLTGDAPWSITYTDGITPNTITGITSSPYNLIVNPATTSTFALTAVSDANGAGIVNPATVTVYVSPTASIVNTAPLCTSDSAALQVSFTGYSPWILSYSYGIIDVTDTITGTNLYEIPFYHLDTLTYVLVNISDSTSCPGLILNDSAHVYRTPVVTVQSAIDNFCSGQSTAITMSADMPEAVINWTVAQTDVTGAINGTGDEIIQTINTTGINDGAAQYTIIASTDYCLSVPSIVSIGVFPALVVFATPMDQNVCDGSEAEIALSTNIPGASIFWTVEETGATGAQAGVGDTILQTLSMTGTNDGFVVYTISAAYPNCDTSIIQANATIRPVPDVVVAPLSQIVCTGFEAELTASSTTPGVQFNWIPTATDVSGASIASGDTISQTLILTGNVMSTVQYTLTSSTIYCSSMSAIATVDVYPPLTASVSPASSNICSGSEINLSNTANVPGATFNWIAAQTGVSGALPGNGNIINQTLTASSTEDGMATYNVTASFQNCADHTVNTTVLVYPIPAASVLPVLQSICTFDNAAIDLSSDVNGTTFVWTAVPAAGITGASSGSGSFISQSLYNTGSNPANVIYTATPNYNNCIGDPVIATVTVNPYPVVSANPASESICSGSSTNISLNSYVSGTLFTWTVQADTSISGATDGSGSLISQTLINSQTNQQDVTYFITPSIGTCSGSPASVIVTVNSVSEVMIQVIAGDTIFCEGDAALLMATPSLLNQYQWKKNGTNIPNTNGPGYGAHESGFYSVMATNNYNCTSLSNAIQITVHEIPVPEIHSEGNLSLCVPDTVVLTTINPYVSYHWSNYVTNYENHVTVPGTYTVTVTDTNGCTGSSQIQINETNPISQPEICMVTVDSLINKNVVIWEKEQTGLIASYKIYKESTDGNFLEIANIPYDSLSLYTDNASQPEMNNDSYKISSVDTCGNESPLSNPHRTVYLSVIPAGNGGYNLLWPSGYSGYNPNNYRVYRWDEISLWEELALLPNTASYYSDATAPAGIVKYLIGAVKSGSACAVTPDSFTQSLSNIEEVFTSSNALENNDISGISVYPNPLKQRTKISFVNNEKSIWKLNIQTLSGQVIKTMESENNYFIIERDNLKPGVYIIELTGINISRIKLAVLD